MFWLGAAAPNVLGSDSKTHRKSGLAARCSNLRMTYVLNSCDVFFLFVSDKLDVFLDNTQSLAKAEYPNATQLG